MKMKKILALVLAMLMLTLTACAVAEDAKTVMTHEEYAAAELDTEVTIEAYVQAKQSWWDNKATIYLQAEDGAYFIYNMAISQEDYDLLVPGTKIRVTGYKSEWSGEVEITDATFEILEAEPWIAEAEDVTELLRGNVTLLFSTDPVVCADLAYPMDGSYTEQAVENILSDLDAQALWLYPADAKGA